MLYMIAGMLKRWKVLCKEKVVLQVDVLVAKLEDRCCRKNQTVNLAEHDMLRPGSSAYL
jgi:hypothetical protein